MALVTRLFDDMHGHGRTRARAVPAHVSQSLAMGCSTRASSKRARSSCAATAPGTTRTHWIRVPFSCSRNVTTGSGGTSRRAENGVVSDAIYEHLHLQRPAPTDDTTDAAARPPHSRG
jgi:hypothetical protein